MYAEWIEEDGRFAFGDKGDVQITAVEHAALINGQSQGKQIVRGADSRPALADPVVLPPTLEQVHKLRLHAYRAESDPLKIESEHDALISGTDPHYAAWLAKVAEIKQRYPLPA